MIENKSCALCMLWAFYLFSSIISPWSTAHYARAEQVVTSQADAKARELQLEGTRLQLKGDLAGAIKKYKKSIFYKSNARLESLIKVLERQVHKKKETQDAMPQPAESLFDGSLGEQWLELSANGGNFKEFARIEDHMLIVDVPKGNKWGKTGIRSANPLIKMPENEEKFAKKLTFSFDPSRSSDFVFALIPSNWDGNLEWRSHHIRVSLAREEDDKNSSLSLWIKQAEVMKMNLEPQSLEQISIILRPDRLVLVTDGTDKILLQGFLPDNLTVHKEGYRISALASAAKENMAAKLALRKISLIREQPFDKEIDPSLLLVKPNKVVLFDGKVMGHLWEAFVVGDAQFNDTASIKGGMLDINVPLDSGNGNVGIKSSKPVVWLDQFGNGAERSISFRFQPEHTTGFALALADNAYNYIVKWAKDSETDKAILQIFLNTNLALGPNWPIFAKPVWQQNVRGTAPEEIILTLKPGVITLTGDGLPEYTHPCPLLQPNSGFHIYAYTYPFTYAQAPVKMALKQIVLNNTILKPVRTALPMEGIAPLPVKTFFSKEMQKGWEITPWATLDNKPLHLCSLKKDGFAVAIDPENALPSLDGCTIHPDEQIITIDERLDNALYKVSAYFDPEKTKNFRLAWSSSKKGHNWNYCELSLLQSRNEQNVFGFNCSYGSNHWQRNVSSEWLNSKWNGRVNIIMGKEWIQGELEGGPSIRANQSPAAKMYIYVLAPDYRHTRHTKARAHLLFTKLTGEWVPHHGLKAVERWQYIDKNDFDPDAFMKDLSTGMPFPNTPIDWSEEK